MGLEWLVFLIGLPYCAVCGSVRIKEQTSQRHMLERYQFVFPTINDCYALNNEHDREDFCIQCRNQQTCNSDNHT